MKYIIYNEYKIYYICLIRVKVSHSHDFERFHFIKVDDGFSSFNVHIFSSRYFSDDFFGNGVFFTGGFFNDRTIGNDFVGGTIRDDFIDCIFFGGLLFLYLFFSWF